MHFRNKFLRRAAATFGEMTTRIKVLLSLSQLEQFTECSHTLQKVVGENAAAIATRLPRLPWLPWAAGHY
jgi:uncharacterized protein YceH (UPF0502 family)